MRVLGHPLLLLLLPTSLLLAASAGWLAVSNARPLRVWARYPWRAFWAAYVFALTFPPPFTPGPLHASLVLSACMLVAMYLSAVQGLRVSWRRSPAGGVLVLFGGFVIGALSSVLRLQHTGEWHRLDLMALAWFLAVAYWALMACVADRVARRLAIETPAAPGP